MQEEDTIGVSSDSYITVSGMDVILSAAFILILLVTAYVGLLMWTMWKQMSKKPPKKKNGIQSKKSTKKKTPDKNKKLKKQEKKPMKKTAKKSEKEELETFGEEYDEYIPEIEDI
jgi:Na+-transporting methylmalonyl-CoA/oxaloacetate decarboxylase gamma subunit